MCFPSPSEIEKDPAGPAETPVLRRRMFCLWGRKRGLRERPLKPVYWAVSLASIPRKVLSSCSSVFSSWRSLWDGSPMVQPERKESIPKRKTVETPPKESRLGLAVLISKFPLSVPKIRILPLRCYGGFIFSGLGK
jgi:hypothetical protein